jgi:hypothetical protein
MPMQSLAVASRRFVRGVAATLLLLISGACGVNDDSDGAERGGSVSATAGMSATGGVMSGGVMSGGSAGRGGALGGSAGTSAMGGMSAGGVAGGSGRGGAALGGGGGAGGSAAVGAGGAGTAGAPAGAGAGAVAVGGVAGAGPAATGGEGGAAAAPVSLKIFDEVVFYDAYANVVSEPVPAGVRRLRNDLFTHKLSDEELDEIQSTLSVRVVIGALCDNYDRIGSVALALAERGQSAYVPEDVARIEIGRYITPFMDRNRMPDEVSYEFEADNLVSVFHDAALRAEFDLWLELELFGVPYAANEEISGCANRNDVFRGSVFLESDSSAPAPEFDELVPLAYKESFNDYQQGASDRVGTTRKTVEFTLAAATADTQLVLITSNHGANSGGEEYVRRDHFVYVDGELELEYKPGRKSCEPFRKSNTQANGIYGPSPRSDSEWQSFSNWCPGDRIDTRVIPLGPMSAGAHEFVIDVPDAQFMGDDGNFPFSLYLQSRGN